MIARIWTNRVHRGRGLAALGAVLVLAGGAACTPAPTAPPSPSPSASGSSVEPSASTASTPTPSNSPAAPPSAAADDTVASGVRAVAAYLTNNGYLVKGQTDSSVTYTPDTGTILMRVSCAGGRTHDPGWTGLCTGSGKGAMPMVIPTRVVDGPRAQSVAMSRDDAAYCGGGEAPRWAEDLLKKASKEYCYLKEGDG